MREGGCLCGAVRYRVEGEPLNIGICHCETCRRAASAPRLPFVGFPTGRFRLTRGEPHAFDSSPGVTRTFCGRCGSPLTYSSDPDFIDVMTCSLDDPSAFPPTAHVWEGERVAWDVLGDGLTAYRTTRGAGETI